jgi:nucleoside-diphosphate-sugar epimerase
MGLLLQLLQGKRPCSLFGICDASDTAAMHVAGLDREETAGQRYLVCSRDQYSTFELAQMLVAGAPAASGAVDLGAWEADEDAQKLRPKKPATNNQKACALLGVEDLVYPSRSIADAATSLLEQGHVGGQ